MKILLYGSPFDPIHDGHLHMLETVYREKNIDKVILLITKNPRWKQTITSIDDRINMVKLAIKDKPYVELSLFEVESDKVVHFTIDSVRHYKAIYPNDELFYLIGGDQVEQFHKWKDADEYAGLITLLAYPRLDVDLQHPNYRTYHISPILGPLMDVSSTAIRQFQSLQTPLSVIDYILEKELYAVPKIKAFYNPKRYMHVISTAQVAYRIAKANHLEPSHAFLAGYLHDIGKDMDEEAAKRLYQDHDTSGLPVESYALHQVVGAIIAEQEFNIHHEGILEAIRYHTTGNKNMGPLAKIVYSSDKIEPLRGYDSQALIDACCRDLHTGFIEVLKDNLMYLKKKEHKISHPLVKACIQEYLGEEL
jgi:nicotinate-nucleotide adenylyltransferase